MMKLNRILYPFFASTILLLGMQSCFQDLDQDPAFNYPQGAPDPTGEYNPEKIFIPFEDNIDDKSSYQFITSAIDKYTFVDGVTGKAYSNTKDSTYIIINSHPAISKLMKDTISNLGSFTTSFWMNVAKNEGATSLFSITNSKTFWGNLDIFLDNPAIDTEAFFKVQLFSEHTGTPTEHWAEIKIPNAFDKWVHLTFRYDGSTSTLTAFQNGDVVKSVEIKDGENKIGALKFKNVGPITIGTFQFQANPLLTSNENVVKDPPTWAKWLKGSLDQFHFYSKALSDSEIKALYTNKN